MNMWYVVVGVIVAAVAAVAYCARRFVEWVTDDKEDEEGQE